MMTTLAAAANPFVGKDGLVQINAFERLQKRIDGELAKVEGKVVPATVYVYSSKVKPVNFKASAEKQQDFKHLSMRAFKIVERKRVTATTLNKNKLLLSVPAKQDVKPDTYKLVQAAVRTIKSHISKSEKIRNKITTSKGKIREEQNKEFETALAQFLPMLKEAGIKDANIVEANSMFGKVVIIKTGANSYLSIGKADAKRFRDAKKAASST